MSSWIQQRYQHDAAMMNFDAQINDGNVTYVAGQDCIYAVDRVRKRLTKVTEITLRLNTNTDLIEY